MDYAALAAELFEKTYTLRKAAPHKQLNESMQGETFILLYLAYHEGSALPGEIRNHMHISSARIAVALNGLQRKGLITRRIDPSDRRQILVDLTAEGQAAAEQQRQLILENITNMLALLGEQDALEYVRLTDRLAEIVSKGR